MSGATVVRKLPSGNGVILDFAGIKRPDWSRSLGGSPFIGHITFINGHYAVEMSDRLNHDDTDYFIAGTATTFEAAVRIVESLIGPVRVA